MKFCVNRKLATRISIITTAITFAGMLLLWFVVSNRAASMVKSNITNQMTDAVESRAAIINDYIASAEEYMTAFALGSEVRDLLKDPENPDLLKKSQKYTEDFAAVKGVFEGLYIGTPSTYILTHTSQGAIGMTTRKGDSIDEFRDTILAKPHVCECLRKTIDDIGRILGEIADGNIAVDVQKNEDYYIGDFRVLAESLKSIRTHLTGVMRDITQVAHQVDSGAYQVSEGAQALSQGTLQQEASMGGLVSNVADMTEQIQNSTVRCSNASNLVDKAAGFAAEADLKMEQLMTATKILTNPQLKLSAS